MLLDIEQSYYYLHKLLFLIAKSPCGVNFHFILSSTSNKNLCWFNLDNDVVCEDIDKKVNVPMFCGIIISLTLTFSSIQSLMVGFNFIKQGEFLI